MKKSQENQKFSLIHEKNQRKFVISKINNGKKFEFYDLSIALK